MFTNNCINNQSSAPSFSVGSPPAFFMAPDGSYIVFAQPAFDVSYSETVNNVTGDNTTYTMVYDKVNYNVGDAYNAETGMFTAPVAGIYTFAYQTSIGPLVFTNEVLFYYSINGGVSNTRLLLKDAPGLDAGEDSVTTFSGAFDVFLQIGDTCNLTISVKGDALTVDILGDATNFLTNFTGYLVV